MDNAIRRGGDSAMPDAEMETLMPTSSSSKEHSTSTIDLKKKRKLQCGLSILDVPSPKQRHRIGPDTYKDPIITEAQNDLEQSEEKSENDSNSFTRTCYNSMVSDENSLTFAIHQERPSTSLNNYNDEDYINSLYSLESRDIKAVSDGATSDPETIQFHPGYNIEEKYSSFGVDHDILELESEGDAETESMILHSDVGAPHSFFQPSGCWNLGQDVPLGLKKPTIDQEFEQYFSTLML